MARIMPINPRAYGLTVRRSALGCYAIPAAGDGDFEDVDEEEDNLQDQISQAIVSVSDAEELNDAKN